MINGADFFSEEAYNEAVFESQSIPFANESQAALAVSRSEAHIVRQDKEIAELLAQGKSVIVEEFVHYCPRTDAAMGSSVVIKSVYDTIADAEVAYAQIFDPEVYYDDYAVSLRTPQPEVVTNVAAFDSSDIPF